MAKYKRVMECGCVIGLDYDDTLAIRYCPKHKAAPAMYGALKETEDMLQRISQLNHVIDIDGDFCILQTHIHKALAKAEG